jgi:hypothetical protein
MGLGRVSQSKAQGHSSGSGGRRGEAQLSPQPSGGDPALQSAQSHRELKLSAGMSKPSTTAKFMLCKLGGM